MNFGSPSGQTRIDTIMTNWQKQIVIGTVLGGSSLVRPKKGLNYYLSMAGNNPSWLHYKMQELGELYQSNSIMQDGCTYRCASSCTESLTEVYSELFLEGQRNVTLETLSPLRDIALAMWFLDGGGKTGRNKKNAYLNTTKIGEKGTKVVYDYFKDLNWDCSTHESGGRRRVIFSVLGTELLLKTISHRFPDFMYHRL